MPVKVIDLALGSKVKLDGRARQTNRDAAAMLEVLNPTFKMTKLRHRALIPLPKILWPRVSERFDQTDDPNHRRQIRLNSLMKAGIHRYLIPVITMPFTKYRCPARKRKMIGIMTSTEPAISNSH